MYVCVVVKCLVRLLSVFVVFKVMTVMQQSKFNYSIVVQFNLSHAGSSYHYVVCDGEKEVNTFYCPREILLFSFCLWSFCENYFFFSFWHGLFEDLSIRNLVTKVVGFLV